jgi:CRP-like cAMP-binding protein
VDSSRLASFPDLAALPAEEVDELAAAMSVVEIEAGANVITADDFGTAIYFIEQGEADVLDEGGEAKEFVGAGDVVGEIGLLLTGERTATVTARTPMRLLSLSGQDFDRIRERVPAVEQSLRRLGLERTN